jgi:hypothetical protein
MQDEDGNVRRVVYPRPKPNNFEQATQLVVIGEMSNDVFYANDMLMKCPSKYNDASEIEFVRCRGDVSLFMEGLIGNLAVRRILFCICSDDSLRTCSEPGSEWCAGRWPTGFG